MDVREWQHHAHQRSVSKGWHSYKETGGEPDIAKMLLNIHGEVSEAWEEWRKGIDPTETYYVGPDGQRVVYGPDANTVLVEGKVQKPEGLPAELADIGIRLFDMCEALGIDLNWEMLRKDAYNATRPHRHGGKLA